MYMIIWLEDIVMCVWWKLVGSVVEGKESDRRMDMWVRGCMGWWEKGRTSGCME